MPKQSLQDQYRLWKNRVLAGKKRLQDQALDWKESEDFYEGKILNPKKSDFSEQLVSVNLQYVDVRSSVPKLYSQNPYAFIDPETPEADLKAEVLERVVNTQINGPWNLESTACACVKGTKLKGRSYAKISFVFDKDKIARQYVGERPTNEISIDFVDREHLIVEPNARSFRAARWVSHMVTAPIAEIREKFNLREDDKPTVIEDTCQPENLEEEEKEDFQYGTYHEIEDRLNHKLMVIIEGVDRFAVKPYEMRYGFHSMYEELEWNDIPGKLDTKPDVHFWRKQLLELAEIKTQQANHRRKLNSKYISQGKKLTEKQKNDLTSYKDGIVVELQPGTTVTPFQHAQLGQEVYASEQSTRQDQAVISGLNEQKQGLPQAQKTAREAMAIYQEAQDVVSYRAGIVEDFIGRILQKCIWLIQHFYDATRVIAMTGMEEAEFLGFKDKVKGLENSSVMGTAAKPFLSFVGTDLVGQMKVRIKAGSAMPVNEGQRKEEMLQLFEAAGKNQTIAAALDPKEALKEFAKLLHLDNKRIIIDPKSPEQENALLKRGIPVMPMLGEDHASHIAAHQLENNNTPAFLAHLMAHKLLESFIQKSSMVGAAPNSGAQGPSGILGQAVSGLPQGSNAPLPGGPQPGRAVSPPPVPSPAPEGALPN
ncbi:hypothetical protein FBR05_00265 [Deltaproteobacteria bacterium PRO3]|nr:hypothetical protein [Deltaproteobacteria bacterium PRO3]